MTALSLLVGAILVSTALLASATHEALPLVCNTKIQQCHPSGGSMPPDNYTTSSADECCTICNSVVACIGFIYQAESQGCHLKSSMGDLVVCSGSDSSSPDCKPCGIVRTPPPTPGKCINTCSCFKMEKVKHKITLNFCQSEKNFDLLYLEKRYAVLFERLVKLVCTHVF